MNALTSLLLLLLFSTISANSAKANTLSAKEPQPPSKFSAEQEHYLLSQALGHDEWDGRPQMSWDDYQIGTIKGRAGDIISVVAEDGTVLEGLTPSFFKGSNVLIGERDGKKVVLDFAHPPWIETLLEDYGFSIDNDYRSDPPLEVRTAPLWQQLGY